MTAAEPTPVYRAPMRARDCDDVPNGTGAEFGCEHDLVGIGDALPSTPADLEAAATAAAEMHGARAGRLLERFGSVPDGVFVWTRHEDGAYRLGRIAGPYRYEDTPAARTAGIHHVRPARWLRRRFGEEEVPAAVAQTFARGGRNFQRTRDTAAERRTAELWSKHSGS